MNNSSYYEKTKLLIKQVYEHIKHELDGVYDGYYDANAISKYLNDNYDINVACDNEAQRALEDFFAET